jgi:hypothetical protein
MKQLILNTLGFATVAVAFSGLAMAQEPTQGLKLMAGNSELVNTLSTKSAKQGDPISVKLTAGIKTPAGVVLPRGTELLGHIDSVKASDNKGPATLAVTFNQAQLKDGKKLAIKATVAGFAPAGDVQELPISVAADDSFDQLAGSNNGVELRSAVKENVSATLTSSHSNIDLSKGTQFLVAVGVQPAQTSAAAE